MLPWLEIGRASSGPAVGQTFLVSAWGEPLSDRRLSIVLNFILPAILPRPCRPFTNGAWSTSS